MIGFIIFLFFLFMCIGGNYPFSLFGIENFSDYLIWGAFIAILLFIIYFFLNLTVGFFTEGILFSAVNSIFGTPAFILFGLFTVSFPLFFLINFLFDRDPAQPVVNNPAQNEQWEGDYGDYEEPYDDGTHHVDPHWVDGYERSDGTQVDGYWRGGEDGYERSDPGSAPSAGDSDAGGMVGDFFGF
jgi:hypothetical protein